MVRNGRHPLELIGGAGDRTELPSSSSRRFRRRRGLRNRIYRPVLRNHHDQTIRIASKISDGRVVPCATCGVLSVPGQAIEDDTDAVALSLKIDHDGKCHGIGVILDGLAGDGENPARGARYNSAVRYLRRNPDSLIVVVSEDRTVDTIT